jgi:class 3 adenylate cyclase
MAVVPSAQCDFVERSVVERLRSGGLVDPESFESVTISFSNLSGFAEFAAKSTPYKVVTFLNQSHSLFDNVVFNFEVYKVETINDSYVVRLINLPKSTARTSTKTTLIANPKKIESKIGF